MQGQFPGSSQCRHRSIRIGTNLKTTTDFFGTYPRTLIQKGAKEKILFFNRSSSLVLKFCGTYPRTLIQKGAKEKNRFFNRPFLLGTGIFCGTYSRTITQSWYTNVQFAQHLNSNKGFWGGTMLTNSHNLFYTLSILPTRTMDGFGFTEAVHKLVEETTSRVLREANKRHCAQFEGMMEKHRNATTKGNRKVIEMEKSHEAIIADMRENHRNDSAEANRRLIETEKSHKAIIAEMKENHRTVSAEANRLINEMKENHRTVSAEANRQLIEMKKSNEATIAEMMENNVCLLASTKKKLSQCQMEVSSNKRCLQEQFEDLCKVKRSRTSETNLNEVALALEEVAQRVRTRSESPDPDFQPFAFFGTADDDELRRGAELCREIDVNHLGQGGMDHYAQGWVAISGSDDRSPTDVDAQGGVAISGCDAPCNDLEGSFMINNVSYVGYHKGRGGVPKCPHVPRNGQRNSKSSNATFVIFKEHEKKKWGRWVCGRCPQEGADNIFYHCCWRTKGGSWIKEKTPLVGTFDCRTD